jgi:WD40 repeat protein
MRQIGLLPSGCQSARQNSVLLYTDDYIIYASSLAVYILNPRTFQVEKILSCVQRTILSISLCPLNKDLLAVSSFDGTAATWSISNEQVLTKATLGYPNSVAWDPHDRNNCAVISHVNVKLFLWSVHSFLFEFLSSIRSFF